MDAKNSEMPRTADALAGLTEALSRLGAGIAAKKNELAEKDKTLAGQLEKKDSDIVLLKESSVKVIGQIDGIIGKLDNILENNGSGNNNN